MNKIFIYEFEIKYTPVSIAHDLQLMVTECHLLCKQIVNILLQVGIAIRASYIKRILIVFCDIFQ